MNYAIETTKDFENQFKRLLKKYRSLRSDMEIFKKELLENPEIGDDLGNNTRKVRMAIASKDKGKSGGARIITCTVLIDVTNADIYLLTIYDKGERDSISRKEIGYLKKINGLS
jgi:mRNA-degrading endonuclease RelE of RelBE toxin-antitoxin system